VRAERRASLARPAAPPGGRSWRWAAVLLVGGSAAAAAVVGGRGLLDALSGPNPIAKQVPPAGRPATTVPPVGPMLVSNPPPLVGLVRVEGPIPKPLPVAAQVGPDCGHGHPPITDESIVAGPGGTLGNVVVCVSAGLAPDRTYDAPSYPAVLDQKDCKYQPRIVTVQVGQSLVARNSDPFIHNVHTNSRINRPVNVAQPLADPVGVRLKAVESPETFKVTCDLHPWMVAWVAAFDHPYNAVTTSDGAFRMPPLEPGTYTVRAWHERLGAVEQAITIANDWSCPPIVLKFGEDRVAAALADRTPTASAAGGRAGTASAKPACCSVQH
jgi:plastocyanin